MPLSPRTRLGNYEILGPLGSGGMGDVYRARDTRLGRDVAVKVLAAEVASSPEQLARFEREARTVAGLNHPNIVTLFSFEQAGDIRFLTMEIVEGKTLSSVMVPGGLSLPRILELAIPLTDALAAAHAHGVVHRDLKPANVMVTRDGRVKVLDFGLAKILADTEPAPDSTQAATVDGAISGAGQILGTIPYMAPEQLRGERLDARSDLFSLGIILYELAIGHRPFSGTSTAEITSSILRDTPEPLSRLRADLPGDLERIISRCLEKNVRERVQAVRVVSDVLRLLQKTLDRGEPEKRAPEKVASIAVLPFVNRSRDEEDEYFSDGLADELLNVLTRIKGLRVTARSSAFTFKGKQTAAAEIGRALDVATLLEGSVRKAGNRIRVSVQLVSVRDSSPLWSESYDRTLDDIFAVQDDIAQSVVRELRTTLLGEKADSDASGQAKAEVAQARKGRGTDPEAHRLYLLAQHLMISGIREDTSKAIAYFEEALARDPGLALAWAGLSMAFAREANLGSIPRAEGYERARDAANRALGLEPDLPEGHARMAWIRMVYDGDFRGAEASYSRALELSPANAMALRGAGVLARSLGHFEESIDLFRRALEQDPLNHLAYHNLGLALYYLDRFAESEVAYRKMLEIVPQSTMAHHALSLTLLAQGRGEEALAEALREPEATFRLHPLAIIHHVLGHADESDAALRELIEKHSNEGAYQIAEACAARKEVERAFEWLERAYVQRDGGLSTMKVSRFLSPLHHDPRWKALIKRMGLED